MTKKEHENENAFARQNVGQHNMLTDICLAKAKEGVGVLPTPSYFAPYSDGQRYSSGILILRRRTFVGVFRGFPRV